MNIKTLKKQHISSIEQFLYNQLNTIFFQFAENTSLGEILYFGGSNVSAVGSKREETLSSLLSGAVHHLRCHDQVSSVKEKKKKKKPTFNIITIEKCFKRGIKNTHESEINYDYKENEDPKPSLSSSDPPTMMVGFVFLFNESLNLK